MNLIKVVDQMATKEKSFEESLTELETIVKDLESGNVPLDDAITKKSYL